jgi:hypothetical protein
VAEELEIEPTTVRISPKVKYFAQLVARGSGTTFAALIEQALKRELSEAQIQEDDEWVTLTELETQLWAEHEADRLALIGNRFPRLLTARERMLWERIICKTQEFWHVRIGLKRTPVSKKTFNFELLRERWDEVNKDRDELARIVSQFKADLPVRINHPSKEAKEFSSDVRQRMKSSLRSK